MPSLQIARALVARGHPAVTIELFGSRRGQEAALWPTLEFPFTLLPGRGIRRSMSPGALWANAGAVLGLVVGDRCARWRRSSRRRPRVVVVVGGYASFPAGLAAVLARVPAGARQHRCGARGRQRPARTVRRRERGGVPRHRTSRVPRSRVRPVRPELGVARPVAGGPTRGEGRPRAARGAAHAGRRSGARWAPGGSMLRWPTWPAAGRIGPILDLPRRRPA